MDAKVTIFGHPVHPMLIAFPVAFYTATFAAYIAYAATGNPFWFRVGVTANIAGAILAAVAAVPGFVDWSVAIPGRHPAKRDGLIHLLLNVAALCLFVIAAAVEAPRWNAAAPVLGVAGPLLAGVGLACTLGAGWFGWRMVQTHGVGVRPRLEIIVDRRREQVPVAFDRRRKAG